MCIYFEKWLFDVQEDEKQKQKQQKFSENQNV